MATFTGTPRDDPRTQCGALASDAWELGRPNHHPSLKRDQTGAALSVPTRGCVRSLFVGIALCCLADSAVGQTQWPGNGHYYLVVNQTTTWQQARLLAESMMFMGTLGYLATITTEDENTFVTTQLDPTAGAWLGGQQLPGSAEPAEGWQWITGEPWLYTNWDAGEPNDEYGGGWGGFPPDPSEEVLHYHHNGTHWNDLPDDPEVVTPSFIVEWEIPQDADGDGDGVIEGERCPSTPVGEVVNNDGCSIPDLCPCVPANGKWKNHGAYVSCVTHASNDFVDLGLITKAEKRVIVSAAGKSKCGKKK
jgi:hypothetical protein